MKRDNQILNLVKSLLPATARFRLWGPASQMFSSYSTISDAASAPERASESANPEISSSSSSEQLECQAWTLEESASPTCHDDTN